MWIFSCLLGRSGLTRLWQIIISFSITLHRVRNNYLQLLTKMILAELGLLHNQYLFLSLFLFPLASFVVQTTAPFDSCARTYVPECSHFWVEKRSYHNTLVLLTKVLCNRCFRRRIENQAKISKDLGSLTLSCTAATIDITGPD